MSGTVSANALDGNILYALLIQPYISGAANLKKGCCCFPRPPEESKRDLRSSFVYVLAGTVLLVPIINSIVLTALCFYQKSCDRRKRKATAAARIKLRKAVRKYKEKKAKRIPLPLIQTVDPATEEQQISRFQKFKNKVRSLVPKRSDVLAVARKKGGDVLAVARKVTGIDWLCGYFSFSSGALALSAARKGEWKIAGNFLLMSVGYAVNSLIHVFVPQDAKAIGKISNI